MIQKILFCSLVSILNILSFSNISCCLAQQHDPTGLGFIKGYSWGWVGTKGQYTDPAAVDSMKKLADSGAKWVCLAFAANMPSAENPSFDWGDTSPSMVSDDEVRRAIDLARKNKLKIILKPVVNIQDGTWRAWIKFYRSSTSEEKSAGIKGELDPWGPKEVMRTDEVKDNKKWDQWWQNFSGFLVHYAKIAEEEKVEAVCLGCEMNSTESFEGSWRNLIKDVRKTYSGFITYDANHGRESDLAWWDAVDFISISAYYPVNPPDGLTLEEAVKTTTAKTEIVKELQRVRQGLMQTSKKWSKPILFIETGVTNVRGCVRYPWSHPDAWMDSPLDEKEQANYYEALFEVFWGEPWFMGFTWWDWPSRLYKAEDAAKNRGFCSYGKQAGTVLENWYAKPSPDVRLD